MSEIHPTVYLLYGDDTLAISETIASLQSRLGDSSIAAMNTNTFSGKNLDIPEFATVCQSAPFLAERRLVIVADADKLPAKISHQKRFFDVLSDLPESTAVVLLDIVDGSHSRARANYHRKSSLYRWVQQNKSITWSKACFIPKKGAFTQWIIKRCTSLGGSIEVTGASQLAEHVHEDPPGADSELRKILDYVDYQRPITAEDVILLTPYVGEADIFEMVDAIGLRDHEAALKHFHRLLDEKDVRLIFGMIIRQFRMLIQIRSVLDRRRNPAQILNLKPFVLQKLSLQAKNFNLQELKAIYRELYDMDTAIKTSRIEPIVALDAFIVRHTYS